MIEKRSKCHSKKYLLLLRPDLSDPELSRRGPVQSQVQSLFPSCFAHWAWQHCRHGVDVVANPLARDKAQEVTISLSVALCTLKLWVGKGREEPSALLLIHQVRSTRGNPTTAALLMDLYLIQRHAQVGYPSLPPFITPLWLAACLSRSLPLPLPTTAV